MDFDSADGNVHCGIWTEYTYYVGDEPTPLVGAYAGCRPADAEYETVPSSDPSGNVGCRGGQIFEERPAEPVCNGGQAFQGEYSPEGPVGALPVGSSLSYAGFTCTSPDEQSIQCVRDGHGTGFLVGRSSYRYF